MSIWCATHSRAIPDLPRCPQCEIETLRARVAELEAQRNANAVQIDLYLDVLTQCAHDEWNRGVYGPARQIIKQ